MLETPLLSVGYRIQERIFSIVLIMFKARKPKGEDYFNACMAYIDESIEQFYDELQQSTRSKPLWIFMNQYLDATLQVVFRVITTNKQKKLSSLRWLMQFEKLSVGNASIVSVKLIYFVNAVFAKHPSLTEQDTQFVVKLIDLLHFKCGDIQTWLYVMIITDMTKMARRAGGNIFGNIVVRSKIVEFLLLCIEKYFYAAGNGQYYGYYIRQCIWVLYKMIKYNSDLVLLIVRNKKFKSLLDIALLDRTHVDFDMNIRISAHLILKFIQRSDMKCINIISLRYRDNINTLKWEIKRLLFAGCNQDKNGGISLLSVISKDVFYHIITFLDSGYDKAHSKHVYNNLIKIPIQRNALISKEWQNKLWSI